MAAKRRGVLYVYNVKMCVRRIVFVSLWLNGNMSYCHQCVIVASLNHRDVAGGGGLVNVVSY